MYTEHTYHFLLVRYIVGTFLLGYYLCIRIENSITMKEDHIEKMYLGIPYNSVGFKDWLVTSRILSEAEAKKQIDLIREADIEL